MAKGRAQLDDLWRRAIWHLVHLTDVLPGLGTFGGAGGKTDRNTTIGQRRRLGLNQPLRFESLKWHSYYPDCFWFW